MEGKLAEKLLHTPLQNVDLQRKREKKTGSQIHSTKGSNVAVHKNGHTHFNPGDRQALMTEDLSQKAVQIISPFPDTILSNQLSLQHVPLTRKEWLQP